MCEHGHEWKAVISNRAKGDKCPYCSGKLAIQGKNDLCTLYPEIANQWCAERNGSKFPTMYLPMSNEKVWWRCDKGHEWAATIASRTAGSGCPKRKGRHTNDKKLI